MYRGVAGLPAFTFCASARSRRSSHALLSERRRRGCSREDRVGVLVVVLIDETVDRRVLGLERLEHGEQLRGLQDGVALGVKVQELDVAVALADRDVLPRDRADAGAVEVRHLFEIEQDPRATFMAEGVHQLDEWRHAVLEDQPALEVQDDHATHLTLGNLHKPIAAPILAKSIFSCFRVFVTYVSSAAGRFKWKPAAS